MASWMTLSTRRFSDSCSDVTDCERCVVSIRSEQTGCNGPKRGGREEEGEEEEGEGEQATHQVLHGHIREMIVQPNPDNRHPRRLNLLHPHLPTFHLRHQLPFPQSLHDMVWRLFSRIDHGDVRLRLRRRPRLDELDVAKVRVEEGYQAIESRWEGVGFVLQFAILGRMRGLGRSGGFGVGVWVRVRVTARGAWRSASCQ